MAPPASLPTIAAATVPPGAAALVGAGNIARCDRTNDEATGMLLDSFPTATVFTAGDNINGNASLNNYNNCYRPSWGRNKARTRPAVGENDYKTANATGFLAYFGAAGGDSAKYYYSYDLGAWHIMVLNDEISMAAGSPQEQWLRADLASNTKQCTLAYWDHPRFSSTGTHVLASVLPLWNALYAYNADVVVNGHYTLYERFAPQNPTGAADALGMREFIVGTGGLNLQNPGAPRPNSEVRNGTTYGVLAFILDAGTYSWQFLPIAGQTFTDAGSNACHTHIAVASVDVAPSQASILVGTTAQLTATPKDAAGNPLTGRVVTWASSDTTVAKVDANGLVTGKAAGGPVTITATSEGKSGTSAITVTPIPVASVAVSPATATIQLGATVQLTATPKDANGNPLTGRVITWQTSDATIATVDANGLVTGKATGGPVTITATSEGKSGTSAITVIPIPVASVAVTPATASVVVGATVQLTATPKDANGNPLTGRTITWQTSDATIATVDANGLVTGVAIGGPVTITATSEGKSGTSAVTVIPIPVASVDVTPTTASVLVGATVQLTATPKDANGNPLTGRVITWQTSDATIATVDASGLVTGKAAGGPVTITATSEGKSGTSAITVTPIPVASVDVTPTTGSIQVGATLQLTGTPKDANGNPLTGRVVTWQTSDATIATVDANGLVTGKAAGGPVTITATSEGKSGTSAITVIPVPVASVAVTPATASVVVGATVQLTATPKDANGNPLTGRVITWQTSDATIATVDANGLVTGVAIGGPVTITATSEGKSGTSAITVVPIPVASVAVTPATASVVVGATVQLTATPKDANGNPLTGRVVTWQTSDATIATVDASGLVTGKAAGGPVTITATSEGKSGTSAITVTPIPVATVDVTPATATIQIGATVQLTATPKDANGNPLTGRVITWQTSDATIATVDATGLVTGKGAGGPVTITATSEGKSGTSAITVIPVPVASVTVTPSPASVVVGATVQLTATPKDANGNPLTGRVITWQTSDATIATVDANGLVTGKAVGGPVTITATSEGKSGTSAVTVSAVPVASVDVTPTTGSIQVGATLQLTATPKDANGNPLTGRVVTWQTSDATIATVDASGLVTGKAAGGPATITATSEGKSGTSAITVIPIPVATVDVTPATGTVQVGATLQLTATPKDANGNALTGRVITWQTSDATIATVDATGLVTGKAAGGPVTITATSEGKSGTSAITVIPIPVASVAVTPATASVAVGATVQLTATPKDANGNPLTGRTITWQTSDATIATVDANGLVTGKAAGGPVTITATSEGQSGSSAITVTAVPVASVAVTPATASIVAGTTVQLTATPKDANGNPLTGRVITWQSSNSAIASVDANGLVTGKAAGGPVTITATSEGKSGTAAITVTPVPVATVTVSPASASVQLGTSLQLTATLKDANGNVLTGRVVTWQSSAPGIVSVSAAGLVQGLALGSATITATSETKSGTAAIMVVPVPVASITMSPVSATIPSNGTLQITATPKDANGNALAGRVVTWSSSSPTVAVVNANGFVVALQAGATNVTATSEGVVGTTSVTVQQYTGPPVVVGAGDIADCSRSSQEATAEVLDKVPGTVITLGDMAYNDGTLTEFMTCYDPSWGRHKPRTKPAPGNHEYNSSPGTGYYQYFGAAAGDPTKGYYSYDLGAWHIVVINDYVDIAAGSAQEQWLRADLAAHPTACTLAYWHEPRFSSGGNGSSVAAQPIWQALYDYGADLVLNGHDHDYERFAPQTPAGALDTVNGIREIVSGTGGNSLYSWPGNPIANSVIRDNTSYGAIKVTLWPTSYDWEFVPIAGATFTDKGSALCHSGSPLPNQAPIANPGGPYSSEGTVTLDGTQSRDPDNNNPLTYAWTLGDGATATTPTVTHTYAAMGVYTVTLTVRDSKGLSSAPASTTVTVANVAPVVNAGPDQSVLANKALTIQGVFTDVGPTDNPWTYTIAWGDGATDNGSTNTQGNLPLANHVYPTPGRYTVRVTVSDKYGASGFDDMLVKVLDPTRVQYFTGASNITSCGTDEDELTAEILDTIPGYVFVAGDNVNPSGSLANYTNCYNPTWGRHKARTYPVLGNHEYDVAGATGYFTYFGAIAGDPTKGYYSFDLGDWHIIVLNNTTAVASGAGSVQELWLKADLAASTKYCTLALFHYPLFFSSDDPSWHTASGVLPFWNDLYAAGADVVVNGQSYFYERFAPQSPAGVIDSARGITEFNPGSGGYAVGAPASVAPNSQAVSISYGVLKLTLGPDSYIWQFIPAAGESFSETGSGNCH